MLYSNLGMFKSAQRGDALMKHLENRPNQPLEINLGDFVLSVSWAMDLASPKIFKHSARVAYIASRLCSQLGLDEKETNQVLFASLIHDSGISSSEMKLNALAFDLGSQAKNHCIEGYHLMKDSPVLSFTAPLILHHHLHWESLGGKPEGATREEFLGNLIHLADRVEISINREKPILPQKDRLVERIASYSGTLFSPRLVEAFQGVAREEAFWLNIESGYGADIAAARARQVPLKLSRPEIKELASIFAQIVDRKSPFTRQHSQGVAQLATRMAAHLGFSPEGQEEMEIAGLLHDLGKLSIPDSILEKPGPLTPQERMLMKQHTFYTYHLLDNIEAFDQIKDWASYHHETLQGTGYPFRLSAGNLSLESRIMGACDVYQALSEDRPYRRAMEKKQAFSILEEMCQEGALDPEVVSALKEMESS